METPPSSPQPFDHEGPSDHEGWSPTAEPAGELDLPDADGSGVETNSAPGIAFDPDAPTSNLDPVSPPHALAQLDSDELTAMRERLTFYESFDSLIRDNIDRAGALLREAATKQGDAEIRLKASTRDFEQRQLAERTGYRAVFASILDEVSTIQQQVERLARRVADSLDDLELQLPAVGELAAMERGQAPGMSGLVASIAAPAGLPSGASSAAWVTHDGDLPSSSGTHHTSTHRPDAAAPDVEPLAHDDVQVVEAAVGHADPDHDLAELIDPDVVEEVLTEGTDADPEVVAPAAEPPPESAGLAEASDLPEEFGLSDLVIGGEPGVIDRPYVEQAPTPSVFDSIEDHPIATDESDDDGHHHHATDSSQLDDDDGLTELDGPGDTPLRNAAPAEHDPIDAGFLPFEATAGFLTMSDISTAPLMEREVAANPAGVDRDIEMTVATELVRSAWGSIPPSSAKEPIQRPVDEPAVGAPNCDTIVLVHGVPRATTALSLKRYLEGLSAVSAVEPREYAEGVLRLQVTGERAIRIADLSAWPDGDGLEAVRVRDDLVEIRLPEQ